MQTAMCLCLYGGGGGGGGFKAGTSSKTGVAVTLRESTHCLKVCHNFDA